MGDPIERLSAIFERFPGIGPRQAQRFVQFLLRSSSATRRELMESVRQLGSSVHQCPECMRFSAGEKGQCSICSDSHRDFALLAVVASDADLLALERSHTYRGRYFVLGGLISLASDTINGLRIKELLNLIGRRTAKPRKSGKMASDARRGESDDGDVQDRTLTATQRPRNDADGAILPDLKEIILAFPVNPEGDSTAIRVREELAPVAKENKLKISTLGRGLSTGSELEYADSDTLKSALDNRK